MVLELTLSHMVASHCLSTVQPYGPSMTWIITTSNKYMVQVFLSLNASLCCFEHLWAQTCYCCYQILNVLFEVVFVNAIEIHLFSKTNPVVGTWICGNFLQVVCISEPARISLLPPGTPKDVTYRPPIFNFKYLGGKVSTNLQPHFLKSKSTCFR